jgi:hypothetical protein
MTDKTEPKEKKIRILWGSDEDIPALYANHLLVSFAGGSEFHLIFGHLSPPLLLGREESELPDSVKIKPVAKIVISPAGMKQFIEALNKNYAKYESQQERSEND